MELRNDSSFGCGRHLMPRRSKPDSKPGKAKAGAAFLTGFSAFPMGEASVLSGAQLRPQR